MEISDRTEKLLKILDEIENEGIERRKVLIFSGAGLSAESGVPTFRDNNGYWDEYNVEEVCTKRGFELNPTKVLEFYDKRRMELNKVEPNHAHKVIAELQKEFPDNIIIITQNVDDLLERAGCKNVIHVHGFLPEVYCTNCNTVTNIGYSKLESRDCEVCGSKNTVRHRVVMFNEPAPEYFTFYTKLAELDRDDMIIVIGTSGQVISLKFVKKVNNSIFLNLTKVKHDHWIFKKVIRKTACEGIDEVRDLVREFLEECVDE